MKPLTLIEKAFLLKRTPLFSSLDLDMLLAIADKLILAKFDPLDRVFSPNDDANRMYFIVKGEVQILIPPSPPTHILRHGDFFGEESLFNNKPRSYEALCLTETFLLTLSRPNLYTIISECPSVAIGFLHSYTSALNFRPIKPSEVDK